MAGFNHHVFGRPESWQASRKPVRPIPARGDCEDETRVIADAWARHASASGGFADVGGVSDEPTSAREQRQY